jgi:hypothetical protein
LRKWLANPPLTLLLVVVAAVIFGRRPDMFLNPQFWAEDGWFFQRAYIEGANSLGEIYAGYQHALPRLASWVAVMLEPRLAPALFVTGALALTLYVAARTQSSRCPLAPSPLLALSVAFVPDALEVLLVMANVQWVLAAGLVLLLISADAKTNRQHAHDLIAALLLGLTGPVSAILAPLFFFRWWRRRSLASLLVAAAIGAAAAVQAYCLLHSNEPIESGTVSPLALAAAPGFRIAGSLVLGAVGPARATVWLGLGCTVLLVATLVAAAWRRDEGSEARRYIAAACVLLLGATVYRCRFVGDVILSVGLGARYFFPLQLLVLWLLLDLWRRSRLLPARLLAVLLGWIAVVNVIRLREPALIDQHWATYAERIRTGEAVVVPINPDGWAMTLPEKKSSVLSLTPAQFQTSPTPPKP